MTIDDVVIIFKNIGIILGAVSAIGGLFTWLYKKITKSLNDKLDQLEQKINTMNNSLTTVKDDLAVVKSDVQVLSNRQTDLENKNTSRQELDKLIVKTLRVIVDDNTVHPELKGELDDYLIKHSVN